MTAVLARTFIFLMAAATAAVSAQPQCPSPTDSCMNNENYAVCQDLIKAGCQTLMTLESCPLQFACGDDENPRCPARTDPCVNDENYAMCLEFVEAGCKDLQVMKSCPLQFACGDDKPQCPDRTDACMNDENYAACLDLVEAECKNLLVQESCPVQFACGDDDGNEGVGYDACVSLFVYGDKKCSGEPLRVLTFPTMSKPGSPCCKFIYCIDGYQRDRRSFRNAKLTRCAINFFDF